MEVKKDNTIFALIFSFCILILCSCGSEKERQLLASIEQTWQQCEALLPEAQARAEELEDSVRQASEYVRQRYDLLSIRLRDKCNVTPSSPDSALRTMNYFAKHGSDVDRQCACFYLGSAYRDLKDYPRAVSHFLKAVDIAGQSEDADTLVWKNALSQLRYLYMLLLDYEEELNVALQAVELASPSPSQGGENGKYNLGWYLMDAATAYRHLGDTLHCILYCDRAFEAISREHFPPKYGPVLANMLTMYSSYGCYDRLDTLLGQLQRLPEGQRPHNYELGLATFHEKADRTDSAIVHYLTYYDNAGSISGRYEASAGLQRCYYRSGDFRQAARWGCCLYDTNDYIIARRAFEETQRARDTYIYYRDREREQAIVQRDERIMLVSVIITLTLLSIVLGLLTFYNYRKKRFVEQIIEGDQKLRDALGELKQKKKMNRTLSRIALMSEATVDAKSVMELFRKASIGQEKLEEDSWRDLMAATETMYPGFLEALQEKMQGNMNEQLLRTAYLLKIGMTPAQIAGIMETSRQTAWNRVNRVEEICEGLITPTT